MKRNEPNSLGEVLNHFINDRNFSTRLCELRAIEEWERLVGADVEAQTLEKSVDSGILTVRIISATLRHELFMYRSRLAALINAAIGCDTIKEIKIR